MKNKQGFTLIELLTVVLIIGILTAVGLPQYGKVVERSYVAEAEAMLRTIYDSSERLAGEFGYRSYAQLVSFKGEDGYSFARMDMFDKENLPVGCHLDVDGGKTLTCARFAYKVLVGGFVAAKKIGGRNYLGTYILLHRDTMRLYCQPASDDKEAEACDIYNLPVKEAGIAF